MSKRQDPPVRPADDGGGRRARTVSRLWSRALATAAGTFVFGCLYFFVRQSVKEGVWYFDLTLVNKALGTTSLVMIALSMALTGIAFFAGRGSRLLTFRRHHGLVGFWIGLAHGAVNHLVLPATGLRPEEKAETLPADATGLAALVIFGFLAIISLAEVKGFIGGQAWRRILRYGGYAGLVLATAHAALLKWGSWENFVRTFDPAMPSLSLPAALIAAAAVLLRLAMALAMRRRARG
ncbi:MAG TPA: hypothetical protein ENO03_07010 [Candidatus Aminicenantes bacterium]|nr:hypothetical protein [Candidatus Aminicenantes bacterium]HDT14090.1 hypothetical protein [Candidatus Aminicenantes bacterium]